MRPGLMKGGFTLTPVPGFFGEAIGEGRYVNFVMLLTCYGSYRTTCVEYD